MLSPWALLTIDPQWCRNKWMNQTSVWYVSFESPVGAGWKLRCRTFPQKTLSHGSSQFFDEEKRPTDQGKARQYYQDTCRFDESSIHHAASWKPRALNNDWHNQYLDIKHVNDIRCVSSSIFFGQIGWFGAKNPLNNMSLTWNCRNSTGKSGK